MERRYSFGITAVGSQENRGRTPRLAEEEMDQWRGHTINFPSNPLFCPRVGFKMAPTSRDMEERKELLTHHTLVVKEKGPLGLRSTGELKDIIFHHFDIRKHEFYVYCSRPGPFIVIFSEQHARDVVFVAGRVIDGAVELCFSVWDLDEFGDRTIIPYHVKLSIEGIPQHAWSQEIADKILCDEALIHHVEECTRKRIDQRAYNCWAFSKDPSRIL
jgi:hypothetical protein